MAAEFLVTAKINKLLYSPFVLLNMRFTGVEGQKGAMTVQEKENRVDLTPPNLQVGDITVALAASQ